jgi:hypothetical protein
MLRVVLLALQERGKTAPRTTFAQTAESKICSDNSRNNSGTETYPRVIPNTRVFTSGRRDLACSGAMVRNTTFVSIFIIYYT